MKNMGLKTKIIASTPTDMVSGSKLVNFDLKKPRIDLQTKKRLDSKLQVVKYQLGQWQDGIPCREELGKLLSELTREAFRVTVMLNSLHASTRTLKRYIKPY